MIKKITIEAISIKPTKKDGSAYTWKDTKTNTLKTRTMVSIKSGEDWYTGWSYKAGSAAETLKIGDTPELFITEEADKVDPTKIWKSWKFPKPEDKANQEIAELKAKLAAMNTAPTVQGVGAGFNATPSIADGSVPVSTVPF
jgi:hypothetical protein